MQLRNWKNLNRPSDLVAVAMVEIASDIKGLKDLAKNSDKLKKNFESTTLRTALRGGSRPLLRVAKAKVPIDEGDLKKALAINAKVNKKGEGYADVGFRPAQAFHGGFVELGTSTQQAQPYLRPALEEAEGEITDAFIGALNKTIEKALGKL